MPSLKRRSFVAALAAAALLPATAAFADHKSHKLALQISDNNAEKMNAVLNVAINVSKEYETKGEEVEIQIVAFNAGLHMLREDTSPVKERIASFRKSMINVEFKACGNTLESMTKREGKPVPLMPGIPVVTAGVTTLMELAEHGWTIVRP